MKVNKEKTEAVVFRNDVTYRSSKLCFGGGNRAAWLDQLEHTTTTAAAFEIHCAGV